jgi:2,5-dihydroxypyridine 5,6-dioxygenase
MKFQGIRGARVLVERCLNLQAGEEFLVVTDTNKLDVGQLIASAGMQRDARVSMTVMPPLPAPGAEPPKAVASAMKASHAIVMATTYTLTMSNARMAATNAGARILSQGGIDENFLAGDFYQIDYARQKPVVDKIAGMLGRAKKAKLTNEAGTEIEIPFAGRKGFSFSGVCHNSGDFASPPDIEAFVAPLEDATEGTLVVNGSTSVPEIGVLVEPIQLDIRKGTITDIRGAEQAKMLKNKLDSYDDPNVFRIGELGIGLNPWATRFTGISLIDEGIFGSAHLGIGQNVPYLGTIMAKTHIDLIVPKVTLELDGTTVLRNGKLQA